MKKKGKLRDKVQIKKKINRRKGGDTEKGKIRRRVSMKRRERKRENAEEKR